MQSRRLPTSMSAKQVSEWTKTDLEVLKHSWMDVAFCSCMMLNTHSRYAVHAGAVKAEEGEGIQPAAAAGKTAAPATLLSKCQVPDRLCRGSMLTLLLVQVRLSVQIAAHTAAPSAARGSS